MLIRKGLFALLAVSMMLCAVSAPVFANEEGKTCHADTDCGHGEHCKDGHCHK